MNCGACAVGGIGLPPLGIARQVAQVLGQIDAVGQRLRLCEHCCVAGLVADQGDLVQGGFGRGPGLHGIEAIGGLAQSQHRVAQRPGTVALGGCRLMQGKDCFASLARERRLACSQGGIQEVLVGDGSGLLAQADQHHPRKGAAFGHALDLIAIKPTRGAHVVIGTFDDLDLDRTGRALQAYGF